MIAKRVKAKFKASTSSISGLLGHIYQVTSLEKYLTHPLPTSVGFGV
jgi:hypothetical protein